MNISVVRPLVDKLYAANDVSMGRDYFLSVAAFFEIHISKFSVRICCPNSSHIEDFLGNILLVTFASRVIPMAHSALESRC